MGYKVDELYVAIVGSYVLIVLLVAVFLLEKLMVLLTPWATAPCVGC